MNGFVDAHIHLADARLAGTLPQSIEAARQLGISYWLGGGVSPEDWAAQQAIEKSLSGAYKTCFGLHPWWVSTQSESEIIKGFELLTRMAPQACALGETGLDRARGRGQLPSYELQLRAFRWQLELALKLGKPLVLHVVQAHEEAITILKEVGPFPNGGLVHSFSAHFSIAKRYIDMGFLISVGAEVTRLQSPVREAVVEIPMHALAIETDAPDQPPFSHGVRISQLNEPAFLVKIAQSVGLLRGMTPEQVLEDSSRNIRRVFLF